MYTVNKWNHSLVDALSAKLLQWPLLSTVKMTIFLIVQMVGPACGLATVSSCIPVPVLKAVAKICNHQDLVLKTSDLLHSLSATDEEHAINLPTVTVSGLQQSCLKINSQNHYLNHSILAICGNA